MSKPLFQEFDSTSSKSWKQKIQVDLKGADYNDTLVWQSPEQINVKPFYHPDEFGAADYNQPLVEGHNWKIGQSITVKDTLEANNAAKDAIVRGAESIAFVIQSDEVDYAKLLQNLENIPVTIKGGKYTDLNLNNIRWEFDPIGQLASTGNWFQNMDTDLNQLGDLVDTTNQLNIDVSFYQNSGATITQELAYILAHVNEYLNTIQNTKQDVSNLDVQVSIAIGGNYFFEIAKLRALRLLWSTLAKTYGANTKCIITAQPSRRNKSIYDYNVNMLRSTTECMSAVLGGADTVFNTAYDALYHEPNEFGERIARNQLLILKHESYFDLVENPADGSYYIESLTDQLADRALEIFKGIETSGGFVQQLMAGTIQRKIKESAAAEQKKFDDGELVLLGVNTFPNEADRMQENLELDPFLKVAERKTLIEPIIQKRLSEQLEKSRLEKEKSLL